MIKYSPLFRAWNHFLYWIWKCAMEEHFLVIFDFSSDYILVIYFENSLSWSMPFLLVFIFPFLLDESLGRSESSLGTKPGSRVVCWGPFGVERMVITREGFPFVLLAIQMLLRLSLSHRITVWIFQVKTNWR